MLLRNGGTVNLDSVGTWNQPAGALLDIPGSYGQPAVDLLAYLGVDPDNFPELTNNSIPASYGLRQMLLFGAEDWGSDTVVQNRTSTQSWPDFLAQTPFSAEAQAGIARIQTDLTSDWIALKDGPKSDQEKKAILSRITQKQYYMDYIGVPEQAIVWYQRNGHSLLGAGAQAVSAGDMWALGAPGFEGLGLNFDSFPGIGRTPQFGLLENLGNSPDLARRQLVAAAAARQPPHPGRGVRRRRRRAQPGERGQRGDRLPQARPPAQRRADPAQEPRLPRRARPAAGREPRRRRRLAEVDYLLEGSRTGRRVRARHVVMACWNRVTAQIVEGLPRRPGRGPLLRPQGSAHLRPGRAEQLAGVRRRPHREHQPAREQPVLGHDEHRCRGASSARPTGPRPPSRPRPAMLNFTVVPTGPEATPQLAAYEGGRKQILLGLSFRELEESIWDVLDRTRQPLRRRLRPRARRRLDHDQPLELRLRPRADLGVGPVALRAGGGPAAGRRAPAAAATWRSPTATPAPSPTPTARSTRATGRCRSFPELDYVVVGAGAAGCVLANRLSAGGESVCLMESGGSDRHLGVRAPAAFPILVPDRARLEPAVRAGAGALRAALVPAARAHDRRLLVDERDVLRARAPQRLRPLGRGLRRDRLELRRGAAALQALRAQPGDPRRVPRSDRRAQRHAQALALELLGALPRGCGRGRRRSASTTTTAPDGRAPRLLQSDHPQGAAPQRRRRLSQAGPQAPEPDRRNRRPRAPHPDRERARRRRRARGRHRAGRARGDRRRRRLRLAAAARCSRASAPPSTCASTASRFSSTTRTSAGTCRSTRWRS